MAHILIAGGTGLVGKALGQKLKLEGHDVTIISRSHPEKVKLDMPFLCQVIQGDLSKGVIESKLLSTVDFVINLMGESVATKRWTKKYKQKLVDSRVLTTQHLRESFLKLPTHNLKGYLGASAIGYYPTSFDHEYSESSDQGQGFLSELVMAWEGEHQKWQQQFSEIKLTCLRIGVVHSLLGGALKEVLPLFSMRLGSALASGKQWMSWIDIADLVGVISWLLKKPTWSPVYNAVSPYPVTNLDWSKALAKAMRVGLIPNAPSVALKIVLGERAQILLNSQKIVPKQLESEGYTFLNPTLESSFEMLSKVFDSSHHVFVAEQFVPQPLTQVFDFFSQAQNLEKISPPFLKFKMDSSSQGPVYKGKTIKYNLKIRGVPATWVSEITNWEPPYSFSDLQLKGPYQYWHHTHAFQEVPGGTLITDTVKYELPLSPLGDWVAAWYVRNEILQIFKYRKESIGKIFY